MEAGMRGVGIEDIDPINIYSMEGSVLVFLSVHGGSDIIRKLQVSIRSIRKNGGLTSLHKRINLDEAGLLPS